MYGKIKLWNVLVAFNEASSKGSLIAYGRIGTTIIIQTSDRFFHTHTKKHTKKTTFTTSNSTEPYLLMNYNRFIKNFDLNLSNVQ